MAGRTKKVILFLVDGPTDEGTLSPVLKKIFQNAQVRFHIVHGDITSELSISNANAVSMVNEHIKMEMDRYGFRRSDIIRIIHLIDTDGAFIPSNHIIAGDVEKIQYTQTHIIARYPDKTIKRNGRKTQAVKRLYPASKLGGIPYGLYYFSRNLEHALHGNIDDLSDAQKMDYADEFADRYVDAPDDFIQFLTDFEFTVQGDYGETWRFILAETNSLHRHCNLHLLFQKDDVDRK